MKTFKFVCNQCGAETVGDYTVDEPVTIYPAHTDDVAEIVGPGDFFIACSRCSNREKIYIPVHPGSF